MRLCMQSIDTPTRTTADARPPAAKVGNRLAGNKVGGQSVHDYWSDLFNAKDDGRKVIWYNGTYIPPMFQTMDLAWVHGEAWSAYLAAKHGELPAQKAGEDRGYVRELCSYARTHIGSALLDLRAAVDKVPVDPTEAPALTMSKLPPPDML